MSKPATPSDKSHRRHYGKLSPLDRQPEAVKAELRKRCMSDQAFREMQAWLFEKHRVRTSIDSLSRWWRRQQLDGWAPPANSGQVMSGAFEIIVTAPGASEVRVQIRPLPTSQAAETK